MPSPETALQVSDLADRIARRVVGRIRAERDPFMVLVGVSNRHVHLSQEDLAALFGQDAFTVYRDVRQPGEFAATEFVSVHGPKATFDRVRCMGPCRPKSQVELSRTDCVALGIEAPVTQSGHLETAGPVEITGPRGRIRLEHGAMVAARHLHCGTAWAAARGLKDQDIVRVAIEGPRGGILSNVIVRAKPAWVPEVHLDMDEANALGVSSGDYVRVIKG